MKYVKDRRIKKNLRREVAKKRLAEVEDQVLNMHIAWTEKGKDRWGKVEEVIPELLVFVVRTDKGRLKKLKIEEIMF